MANALKAGSVHDFSASLAAEIEAAEASLEEPVAAE